MSTLASALGIVSIPVAVLAIWSAYTARRSLELHWPPYVTVGFAEREDGIWPETGDLAVGALPISPFGSMRYVCGFCGGQFHEPDVVRIQDGWLSAFKADPHKASDAYRKAWDSSGKARKKYELLGGECR
ncbi:MAG: hypothetical protein OXG55_00240 [bacterium]|nr:hypothetical protein [bacterium]